MDGLGFNLLKNYVSLGLRLLSATVSMKKMDFGVLLSAPTGQGLRAALWGMRQHLHTTFNKMLSRAQCACN